MEDPANPQVAYLLVLSVVRAALTYETSYGKKPAKPLRLLSVPIPSRRSRERRVWEDAHDMMAHDTLAKSTAAKFCNAAALQTHVLTYFARAPKEFHHWPAYIHAVHKEAPLPLDRSDANACEYYVRSCMFHLLQNDAGMLASTQTAPAPAPAPALTTAMQDTGSDDDDGSDNESWSAERLLAVPPPRKRACRA